MYKDQMLCHFVFVDYLSEIYTEETEPGTMEDEHNKLITKPDSPFKGKTPAECHRLLRQLRLGTSDIDHTSFVIMDERSLTDDTVLLVNTLDNEGEEVQLRSIRVIFEIVHWRLLGYMDGEFYSMDEDLEAVKWTEDGVLRA